MSRQPYLALYELVALTLVVLLLPVLYVLYFDTSRSELLAQMIDRKKYQTLNYSKEETVWIVDVDGKNGIVGKGLVWVQTIDPKKENRLNVIFNPGFRLLWFLEHPGLTTMRIDCATRLKLEDGKCDMNRPFSVLVMDMEVRVVAWWFFGQKTGRKNKPHAQ